MIPRVTDARYVSEYVLWLHFSDGVEGQIDLHTELYGPMFQPLLDPTYFAQFSIHPEFGTIVWDNGADFAPEFLYDKLRATA